MLMQKGCDSKVYSMRRCRAWSQKVAYISCPKAAMSPMPRLSFILLLSILRMSMIWLIRRSSRSAFCFMISSILRWPSVAVSSSVSIGPRISVSGVLNSCEILVKKTILV